MQITITTKNTNDSLSWTYNVSEDRFLFEKIIEESGFNLTEAKDGEYLLNFQDQEKILGDFSREIESILSNRELREFGYQIVTINYEDIDVKVNLHDDDDSKLVSLITFHSILKNAINDNIGIEMQLQTYSN